MVHGLDRIRRQPIRFLGQAVAVMRVDLENVTETRQDIETAGERRARHRDQARQFVQRQVRFRPLLERGNDLRVRVQQQPL